MKNKIILGLGAATFLLLNANVAWAKPDVPKDLVRGTFIHYPQAKGGGHNGGSGDQVNDFKNTGVHWAGLMPVVGYQINTANEEGLDPLAIQNAVDASFAEWMAHDPVDGKYIRFVNQGLTDIATGANPVSDGLNTVSFAPLSSDYPSAIAITFYWYSQGSKELIETDTVFNSDFNWAINADAANPDTSKYDLQNIATHEFGHWLVLGDLYSGRDSQLTMYGYGFLGELVKRDLGRGDISGIQRIY